jgi:hypothetical protein
VFLGEVVFVFASHLCASCLYALCFGFGIENHLHLGFKCKTFGYSFCLYDLCIALCLCVSQVASHLNIIYTFKFSNVSSLTTTFINFIL